MRFMVLVKADKNSEAGALPDEKLLTEMGKFNEELARAGVLLAAEGLHRRGRVRSGVPTRAVRAAREGHEIVVVASLDLALRA